LLILSLMVFALLMMWNQSAGRQSLLKPEVATLAKKHDGNSAREYVGELRKGRREHAKICTTDASREGLIVASIGNGKLGKKNRGMCGYTNK
jgi:hypothetical protein